MIDDDQGRGEEIFIGGLSVREGPVITLGFIAVSLGASHVTWIMKFYETQHERNILRWRKSVLMMMMMAYAIVISCKSQ